MAYVPDEAVFDSSQVSHAAFKLYVCYCAHRNKNNGQAWPDRDTVSVATKIDVNYISTLKKELEKAGWLAIEGKRVRPLKGFQNIGEKLNGSIPGADIKEDKSISTPLDSQREEKLNDSIISLNDSIPETQSEPPIPPPELNDSIKELNDSIPELNHSIWDIR
jgi:hypothetical protein